MLVFLLWQNVFFSLLLFGSFLWFVRSVLLLKFLDVFTYARDVAKNSADRKRETLVTGLN